MNVLQRFSSAVLMGLLVISVHAAEGPDSQPAPSAASLQAPAEALMNQSIEVRWRGPDRSGDTIRFVTPGSDKFTPQYVYVGNTKNGLAAITVPAAPGEYEVVYVSQREILTRVPIRVLPATATLEAPAGADINARIQVQVQGPNNAGDYIQITTADATPVRGLYSYVGNHADGSVPLRVPDEPGEYRIGYFTARTLIGSTPITVGAVQAQLQVPAQVVAGARFEVQWQGPDNPGDRLLVADADGKRTGSYAYTGNHDDGIAPLRAPEVPGSYEVVYLTGDQAIGSAGFSVLDVAAALQAPESVTAGHRLAVDWEGPGNSGDVIQIVDPASGNDLAYDYIGNGEGNTVLVTAPLAAGEFELQYVTAGGRILARRPLAVTPAPVLPGELRVLAPTRLALSADDAVEIILDASGSMLQRLDGERRIDIAKRTLSTLVEQTIPPSTGFALRVFGHKQADSCRTDLEMPLAPLDAAGVSATVANLTAMNLARTPIAASLALTEQDLKAVRGERIVVLLTDGEETCDGDPAAVIAALRERGADVRVNIVGFAIDDTQLQNSFERWARLGGGRYFNARGESELTDALSRSVSPAYVVTDAQGRQVAQGLAGGPVLRLPPGDYRLAAGAKAYEIRIVSEEMTTLTLD